MAGSLRTGNDSSADPGWESFKETIRTLYLVENRKLAEVRSEMIKTHQFSASKAQYENRLKKWGFRKNLTEDDWKIVGRKIEKRKRGDKESEVRVDGEVFDSKKVKKAVQRYSFTSAATWMQAQAPSPRTPEGINVCTPLPAHASPRSWSSSPAPFSSTSILANTKPLAMDSLPFIRLNAMLNQEANIHSIATESGSPSSMVLLRDICSGVLGQIIEAADVETFSGSFSQTVKALMPYNVFSNHSESMQMTVSEGHQSPVLNFVNLTLFLISNNFLGTTVEVSKKVYEWVKCRPNAALLGSLMSISSPTAEALTENIFRLAIEADDAPTVRKIIESGFNVEEQVLFDPDGSKVTPLQRACQLRSLDLVRLLIEEGADVNGTFCWVWSALGYAVDSRYGELNPLVVRLLLHAGADANPDGLDKPLSLAVSSGHVEAVALLVSAGADVNHTGIIISSITSLTGIIISSITSLTEAVDYRNRIPVENVIAIVRNLVRAGADVQATARYIRHESDDDDDELNEGDVLTVLEWAMKVESTELIQLLLDGGARITESAFSMALSWCDLDFAKLLLKCGAQVTTKVIKIAAQHGTIELFLFLLDSADHDVQEKGCSAALIGAIHHCRMDLIGALDASGIHFNTTKGLAHAITAAASQGAIHVLQFLLRDNSRYRPVVTQHLGNSLWAAISCGRHDVTKVLLAAGAPVNTGTDLEETSSLLAAIRQRDSTLAKKLLAAGAAVNGLTQDLTTSVLPTAAQWGNHPLIMDIISAGAEVDAPVCKGGKTALTVAVEKGDKVTFQLLLDAGADVNASSERTALEAAIQNNDLEMAYHLLDIGAQADEGSLVAAVLRSVELMQILLAAHLRHNKRCSNGYGSGALQLAIRWKKVEMVQTLLANGVDLNYLSDQNLETRSSSTNRNVPICHISQSALGTAIQTDKSKELPIVQMLLRSGADPNSIVWQSRGWQKRTALLQAIIEKNPLLVEALIAAGADANASAADGISRTPLQLAAEQGSLDITHTLLEHGADVNAPPCATYGATALQCAAIGGYVGIAYLLLERGAEIDAPPAKFGGRTALEGAAEHGRIDLLQFLLNAGARITGPGAEQYERARKLASQNGHNAARRLLESQHALQMEFSVSLEDLPFQDFDIRAPSPSSL